MCCAQWHRPGISAAWETKTGDGKFKARVDIQSDLQDSLAT